MEIKANAWEDGMLWLICMQFFNIFCCTAIAAKPITTNFFCRCFSATSKRFKIRHTESHIHGFSVFFFLHINYGEEKIQIKSSGFRQRWIDVQMNTLRAMWATKTKMVPKRLNPPPECGWWCACKIDATCHVISRLARTQIRVQSKRRLVC